MEKKYSVSFQNEAKQSIENQYDKLTHVEQSVADFFIENKQEGDFSSKNVARLLYVSEATLSRFAKKCGYKGYREFIYVYEKDLEFERASVKKEKDVELFTKKVKDSYQNLLNDSFKMLDDNQIRRIALMFGSYRRVLVFGTGSSGYVAQEFQLRFMRIGMDVAAVTDSQMIRMSAALAGTDTLVVAISLSGRTGDILESIRIAKRGGAAVIFITSNTETEECSLCDEVVKAASIENLDEGTKISPQFPLLVLIDVLYSYYFANDFYFKAQKYKDTLIAIKGTEGAEEKKGE